MIDTVENFVRTSARLLTWILVGGWSTIGLSALGLSLRNRRRHWKVWLGVAAFAFLFAAEMAFPHRFEVADWLRSALRTVGGEDAIQGRRPIQAAVIAILLVAASGLLATFLIRQHRLATPAKLAVLGIGVGLFGFILETISLHQVDRYYVIYWSIWYAGLILGLVGAVWSLLIPSGAVSPNAPSSHARYSVASMAVPDAPEPPFRRLVRLGLLILVLATPELVDLVSRLIAGR